MRLYITTSGRYVGTQDEARKEGKGWYQVDVATDKAGLIDYLNALRWSEAQQIEEPPVLSAIEVATQSYREQPQPTLNAPEYKHDWSKTEIVEYLLYRASTSQVEDILGCIGTRFAELAKEAR